MSEGATRGDAHGLERFVAAQQPVMEQVLAELRRGRKESHWMWFVFPQIAGLGRSATAQRFAIASLDEARAYLAHPVLGPRLRECTALVLAIEGLSAEGIFGPIDGLKFHSSMTLFAQAEPSGGVFRQALDSYFKTEPDRPTLAHLERLPI